MLARMLNEKSMKMSQQSENVNSEMSVSQNLRRSQRQKKTTKNPDFNRLSRIMIIIDLSDFLQDIRKICLKIKLLQNYQVSGE